MRYDTAFLVCGDDQGRQAGRAPLFLQRRDLFLQTRRRRSHDVVPGDVYAGDQTPLGESRHLGEGRVSNNEMSPKASRLRSLGLQDALLAPFKRSMRAEHRQRWQTPQQNERPSGDASPPIAAADKNRDGDDARGGQNNVSRPAQRNQIGIVLVGRSENEDKSGEPNQDEADSFENLHEMAGACVRGSNETIARIKLVSPMRAH